MSRSLAAATVVMAVAVVAGLVPATLGKKYVVGDENGWTTTKGVDYKAWAADKHFVVNDTLVFNYQPGLHNVMIVSEKDYESCIRPISGTVSLTTGKDEVPLSSPGKKYYICGYTGHCASGQKLAISVSEGAAPAPAKGSPEMAAKAAAGGIGSIGFTVVAIVGMMLLF
ncbi:Blue copper protein 1b [Linum perenne]